MARKFVCTVDEPIVQTEAGKVRGYIIDGIYTFHGIKYADSKRFMMPEKVKPWEGVRDALSYGYVSPMLDAETCSGEIAVPHRYWPKSEDCQYLNIWSPGTDGKKPVMVWLHGGGFSAGSSIEQVAYDGENLCRYGEVVVVSLNHRLNILGYLDLSPYGEKYKNSGNVGNADIVAALQWIHDNIAQFGGDPENVTIFGQSGGGGKVASLLQTPAADGLFHKGIIMSGIADGIMSANTDGNGSRPLIDGMLGELGLSENEVEKLETIPYEELAAAYKKVVPAIRAAGGYTGCAPVVNDYYWGDGRKVGFTEHAKTIPVMAGTVLGEMLSFRAGIAHKQSLSDEEQLSMLREEFDDSAEKIRDLFLQAYPDKLAVDALILDSFSRAPTVDYCEKKAEAGGAPVYNYLFSFEFPMDSGKIAWHCSDIPFVFHNTDKVLICNVPGVSDDLENKMFRAWTNFAKFGDPNDPSLPVWPACKPGDTATMVLDRECRLEHNFDKELYKAYMPVAPGMFGSKKKKEKLVILR